MPAANNTFFVNFYTSNFYDETYDQFQSIRTNLIFPTTILLALRNLSYDTISFSEIKAIDGVLGQRFDVSNVRNLNKTLIIFMIFIFFHYLYSMLINTRRRNCGKFYLSRLAII